jgi:hypothetical protein
MQFRLRNVAARLIEDGFQSASWNRSGQGNDERFRSLNHRATQLDVVAPLANDEEPEPPKAVGSSPSKNNWTASRILFWNSSNVVPHVTIGALIVAGFVRDIEQNYRLHASRVYIAYFEGASLDIFPLMCRKVDIALNRYAVGSGPADKEVARVRTYETRSLYTAFRSCDESRRRLRSEAASCLTPD